NGNGGDTRFLRAHQKHEEFDSEERGFLSKLFTTKQSTATNFIEELLNDSSKAQQAFAAWKAEGKTLEDVKNLLEVAKAQGRHDRLYNDYAFYLDLVSGM
ncbi:Inactive elicitor Avr1b, partial [Phytophthora megakarya]